jgi:hypothetical protein
MRLVRSVGIAAALAACSLAWGCGGGEHSEGHRAEKSTPAPAPPTPDTTPIEPLRTPAGLVLKINEPPTATPAPPAEPAAPLATPSPGPAPEPTAPSPAKPG